VRRPAGDGGVVDQHVDPVAGRGDQARAIGGHREVAGHRRHPRPAAAQLRRQRLERRRRARVEQQLGARLGQRPTDRGADVATRPGDQRHPAVEAESIAHAPAA
jgi:hypothetical protein